ncbi:MAG: S41 family peptidase [Tannerellaceae bacterium]|jgi:carboxyl-terminal processing protease|nr:S41 family peptidase [Tannerellaceae bacterium]
MFKLINNRAKICSFILLLFVAHIKVSQAQNDNRSEISKQLEIFNALLKEMEMFYVDSIDVEETLRQGINAMLGGLDPYTEYIPEQDMGELRLITTGEYGGIGASIRKREDGVIIAEPFEGMPAALGGLMAGDRIISIDTVDVEKYPNDEFVSNMLKGLPNTKLKIKLLRPGEKKPRTIELTRKQIIVNQVTYYGVHNNDVGYIYLRGFTDKSAQEVKAAFEDLRENHNIKSLILDLRDNGGGILESAVQIVNLFVPKGKEVVSTKGKIPQWDRIYRTSAEPVDTLMPLAVLINRGSASSAEIVSGALQDMDRAVLIGQRSYGKGLVQSPRELPYNGTLKVTISKYYIPSGRCIQRIDYTHRNTDGSVGNIPDSLTSVFYTSKGRPVRDGGGIRPEFEVEEDNMPTMLYYLLDDYVLFDFITDYVQRHKTIAPIEEFTLADEDFDNFKKYAKEKNFSYDRQSEKILKNLKNIASFEGYLEENDSTTLKELESKLTPDIERDFERFKDQIKKIMSAEIVKRYYFEKGKLIESLKNDPVLDKAFEVLASPKLLEEVLSVKRQTGQASDDNSKDGVNIKFPREKKS